MMQVVDCRACVLYNTSLSTTILLLSFFSRARFGYYFNYTASAGYSTTGIELLLSFTLNGKGCKQSLPMVIQNG